MNSVMKLKKIPVVALVFSFLALLLLPAGALGATANQSLDNLQTAFNGESNAMAKYLAYASKAEQDGYMRVARLFRAAAQAESIHAQNHAEVIRGMGAEPKADVKVPAVKSTRENLEDAIQGETYEQTAMYPGFIKQAKAEGNAEAERTFNYAMEAEGEHARLYKLAHGNLEEWRVADKIFSVCPTCGYTVEGKPTFANCPVCATAGEEYLAIS